MTGGSEEAFASVTPVLRAIATTIARMGDVGTGAVATRCNQVSVASALVLTVTSQPLV